MKRKVIFIIIPVLIVAAAFVAMRVLISLKTEPPKRKPRLRPKIVATQTVTLQDVPAKIIAYGRLRSSQPVILYSEVPGTLMRGSVPFRPAQSFKKGDLLLKIDHRQIRLDINTAKSDMLNALALVLPEIRVDFPEEYGTWQNYFNSCSFEKRLPDLPEAANLKIKLFLSRFNVYKIFFTVRGLEILLEKHFFYAPFDGSIVSTDLRVGSNARNGTRLGQIINLESLEMEVPVTAQDIQWIDHEKPVFLTSSEIGGKWQGKIKRIGKSINTQTQAVDVFIAVTESSDINLYDGVFMQAHIPGLIIKNAVAVPRKAIYADKFVYIIKDGKLDYREIKIARRETDTFIVNGGILNAEALVVDVMQGVAPGMPALAKGPAVKPVPKPQGAGRKPFRGARRR